jgi:hypothetical protein
LSVTHSDPILESTSIAINFDELRLQYQDPSPPGRRIAPRFEVKLEVIILTQTRSFRTCSVNVSASGALLRDLLPPEFMHNPLLDIILIEDTPRFKRRMLFRGKAVGGPTRSSRITFLESARNAQADLKSTFTNLKPLPMHG